jgi:hypothetical protein
VSEGGGEIGSDGGGENPGKAVRVVMGTRKASFFSKLFLHFYYTFI